MLEQQQKKGTKEEQEAQQAEAELKAVEDAKAALQAKEADLKKDEVKSKEQTDKDTDAKSDKDQKDQQAKSTETHIKVENEIINEQIREVQVVISNLGQKRDPEEKVEDQLKPEQKTEDKTPSPELAVAVNNLVDTLKETQLDSSQMASVIALQQQIQQAGRASASREDPRLENQLESSSELIEQTLIKMNHGHHKAGLPRVSARQLRNAEPDLRQQAADVEEYQKGLITLGEKKVAFSGNNDKEKDPKAQQEIEEQQRIVAELKEKLIREKFPEDRLQVLEKNVENLTSRLELRTELGELYKARYELAMAQRTQGDLTNQVYMTTKTAEMQAIESKIGEKFPGKVYDELVVQTKVQAEIQATKSHKEVELIRGFLMENDGKTNGDIEKRISGLDTLAKFELGRRTGSDGNYDMTKVLLAQANAEYKAQDAYVKMEGRIPNEKIIDISLPYQSINPDVFVRKNQVDITKMQVEQAIHSDNPVVAMHRIMLSSNPETIRAVQPELLGMIAGLTENSRMEGLPKDRQDALDASVLLEQRMMSDLVKGNQLKRDDLLALFDGMRKEHAENVVRQGAVSIVRTQVIPQEGYEDDNARMIRCKENTVAASDASRQRLLALEEIGLVVPSKDQIALQESKCLAFGIREAATRAHELIAKKQAVIENQTFGDLAGVHEEFKNKDFANLTKPETSAADVRNLSKHFQKYEMEGWDSMISERDRDFVSYMAVLANKKEDIERIQAGVTAGIDEAIRNQKVDLKFLAKLPGDSKEALTTEQAMAALQANIKKDIQTSVSETSKTSARAEAIYLKLYNAIQGAGTNPEILEQAITQMEDTVVNGKLQDNSLLRHEVDSLVKQRTGESLLYYVVDDLSSRGEIFDSVSRMTGDRNGYIAKQIAVEGARATEFIHELKKDPEMMADVDARIAAKDSTLGTIVKEHVDAKNAAARQAQLDAQSHGVPAPVTVAQIQVPNSAIEAIDQYSDKKKSLVINTVLKNEIDEETQKLKLKVVNKETGKEETDLMDPQALDIAFRAQRTIGTFTDDEVLLRDILEAYLIEDGSKEGKLWSIKSSELADLKKAFSIINPGMDFEQFLHKNMTGILGENNDSRAITAILNGNEAKYFANRNVANADPDGTKDAEIKKIVGTFRPEGLDALLKAPDSPEKNIELRKYQARIDAFGKQMVEEYPEYEKELKAALEAGYSSKIKEYLVDTISTEVGIKKPWEEGLVGENEKQVTAALSLIDAAKKMPTYADTESKEHNAAIVRFYPDVVDVFAATLGKTLGTEEKPCLNVFRKYFNSEMHGENGFKGIFQKLVKQDLDAVISSETGSKSEGDWGDTVYKSLRLYSQGRPETYEQAKAFAKGLQGIQDSILVSGFTWFGSTYEKSKLDAALIKYNQELDEINAQAKGDPIVLKKLFEDENNKKKLLAITEVVDQSMDSYREKIKKNTDDVVEVVEMTGMVALCVIPGYGQVMLGMKMSQLAMSAGLAMVRPAASAISGMGSENTFISTVQGAGGFLAVPVAVGGIRVLSSGKGWVVKAVDSTVDALDKPGKLLGDAILPTKAAMVALKENAVFGKGVIQIIEGADNSVVKSAIAAFKEAPGATEALISAANSIGKIETVIAGNLDDVLLAMAKEPGKFNQVFEAAHSRLTSAVKASDVTLTAMTGGIGAAERSATTLNTGKLLSAEGTASTLNTGKLVGAEGTASTFTYLPNAAEGAASTFTYSANAVESSVFTVTQNASRGTKAIQTTEMAIQTTERAGLASASASSGTLTGTLLNPGSMVATLVPNGAVTYIKSSAVPQLRMLLEHEAEALIKSQAGFFRNMAHSMVTDGYQGFKVGSLVSGAITALDPRIYEDMQTAGSNIFKSALHGGLMAGGFSAGAGGIKSAYSGTKRLLDGSKLLSEAQVTEMRAKPEKYSQEVLDKKISDFGVENLTVADMRAAVDGIKMKLGETPRAMGLRRSAQDQVARDLSYAMDQLPANVTARAKEVFDKARTVQKAQAGDDGFHGKSAAALGTKVVQRASDAKFYAQKRPLTLEQQQAGVRILESIAETGTFSKLDYRQFTGDVQRYTATRILSVDKVAKLVVDDFHNSQTLKSTDGTKTYDPAHFANQNVPFQVAEYLKYQIGNKVFDTAKAVKKTYDKVADSKVGQMVSTAVRGTGKAISATGDWVSTQVEPAKVLGRQAMTMVTAAHLTFAPVKTQAAGSHFEPVGNGPVASHVETTQVKAPQKIQHVEIENAKAKSIFDDTVSVNDAVKIFNQEVKVDTKILQSVDGVAAKVSNSVNDIFKAIKGSDQASAAYKQAGASDQQHAKDQAKDQVRSLDQIKDVIKDQDRIRDQIKDQENLNRTAKEEGQPKKNPRRKPFDDSEGDYEDEETKLEDPVKKKALIEAQRVEQEEIARLNEELAQTIFYKWRRSGFTLVLEPILDAKGNVVGHEWREKLAVWTVG